MKHIIATNRERAWDIVNDIFPTDYEENARYSERAGYPIYTSTASGENAWISDLNTRIEINLSNGETIMVDIVEEEEKEEDATEKEIKRQQDECISFNRLSATYYAKHITEKAQVGNINMSSIYTKLIQEAGRICENYASDILIDIKIVSEWLDGRSKSEYAPVYGKSFCFAFRKNGVDHWDFAKNRNRNEIYKAYRLDISAYRGYVTADLYEADIH